jgi:HEPN domain-containing protein
MDRWRMNDGPHSQAQILLIKAAEDEASLHVEGLPESIFGFHAQQAVEKLIKALLSAQGVPFELTHNLGRLGIALQATGENLPTTPLSLSELNDFAVLYRYDLLFQFAVPDRAAAIETVRLIREHVEARIAQGNRMNII